jgi:Flp pilus assembly protein TadD
MRLRTVMVVALAGLLGACGAQQSDKGEAGLNVDARMRVALAAEEAGNRGLAVEQYAAAANQAAGDALVQVRCAEGMARNGQVNQAMTLLHARLRADPRQPDLLATLGAIQVLAGEPTEAVQTLTAVLRQRPADLRVLTDLAVAFDLLHQHAEAQVLYRKALAVAPDDVAIRNDLALSLLLSGQPEQARALLLPFRDETDLPSRIRTNLGIAEAASGHMGDADHLLHGQIDNAGISVLTQAIGQQHSKAAGTAN